MSAAMQQGLELFGATQQDLLRLLMREPEGLGVHDISQALAITRNAVRQHLAALERDGYVGRGERVPTGRRPEQLYVLSERGRELFPRRYSLLADLMIDELAASAGSEALVALMRRMGERAGEGAAPAAAAPDVAERSERLAAAMNAAGYEAHAETGEGPEVVARNCVFHHLAARHPEVCEFDLAFMAAATGDRVTHLECMLRGGRMCRFRLSAAVSAPTE